ncbi:substrate-binding domain-containing protein [Paracoccus sp. TK19116]|uniref:Substrate-binding domain-containing protein n=1 Tax=Paracoccus albicereus TaxID=2922394 RepID=A0ABT1MP96_9RHOB|nr:substrate-binding domain-containing protein [Paracoccus albicereus]MCQ0970115.1 substrate-binding domain-containing protein [Paracoccus albicereus]
MIRLTMLTVTTALAVLPATADVFSDRVGETDLADPSITHAPEDGIVKLYGAGGPHTAFQKVADVWQQQTGNKVEIVAGPEAEWSADAQADADILWGTSEQSMTAFLLTYPAFDHAAVEPIYIRPAVIAVKAGNPKGIQGFDDLLAEDIAIVVTEGAGVYNTSGTGAWEDVAGRLGSLEDIVALRQNIVAYALGSGAGFQQFRDRDADAWITWPNWPLTHPDVLELVEIEKDRQIWRDVNVVISPDADPAAQDFLDFLVTAEAQELMATEGWRR